MKKFFCLVILTSISICSFSQIQIYVSNLGDDLNSGTLNLPVKTLQGAYNLIQLPITSSIEIILKNEGKISIAKNNAVSLLWVKSGSSQYPISITSQNADCPATITRPSSSGSYMFNLKNVAYITIKNVIFEQATVGVLLDNVDNSKISYCRFLGNTITGGGGAGMLWIGRNVSPYYSSYFSDSNYVSENNEISYNYFSGGEVTSYCAKNHYQSIYLSQGLKNNKIFSNTFICPISSGILLNHGFQEGNIITKNLLYKDYEQIYPLPTCNPHDVMLANGYDNRINSMHCITLTIDPGATGVNEIPYINNNVIQNNYAFSNVDIPSPPQHDNISVNASIPNNQNQVNNNFISFGSYTPQDPFWVGYSPNIISEKIVCGDFDHDGFKDDIAVIADYGNSETRIHTFLSNGNSFTYSGSQGWWSSTGYNAGKIKAVVSGDFNHNGYIDDIAVIYDYGNNQTRIHTFLSNGNSFTYSGSQGWWSSTGYNAKKIKAVVSGDFNHNGYIDDIAVIYDYGNSQTRIHTFLSTGNSFTYSGSQGWWSSTGYVAVGIKGVVSGDFNHNGYIDDIAVIYDYGNSQTRIHTFLSTGNSFTYSGSQGWWSSTGYVAGGIKSVISGDFNHNGYKDDIAVFYDYGNSLTRIHTFLSNGNSFTYSGSQGWWSSTGYDAGKIKGVVSGDFNQNGTKDDIEAFYDYSSSCGSLRTHVWKSNGSSFSYFNNSLGFPWLISGGCSNSFVNAKMTDKVNEQFENMSLHIYPNPFSNSTTISFSLPKLQNVSLNIFDVNGRLIKSLANNVFEEGEHSIEWNVEKVNAGIYFLQVHSNEFYKMEKLIVTN